MRASAAILNRYTMRLVLGMTGCGKDDPLPAPSFFHCAPVCLGARIEANRGAMKTSAILEAPERAGQKHVLCAFTPSQIAAMDRKRRTLGVSRRDLVRLAISDYLRKEENHDRHA